MYYQLHNKIMEVSLQGIKPDILTVGCISLEELEQCHSQFGFSPQTVSECKNKEHHLTGTLNSYNDYLFGIIIGINPHQIIKIQDRVGMYIKRNLLLIVIIEDQDDSVRNKLKHLLDNFNLTNLSMERFLFGFLESFINEDYTMLVKIEEAISSHEDRINERKPDKNFNYKNTAIRKKLLLLDNYYQQFAAIGEELEENTADLFHESNLHYFRILADRATRLSNNTRMLQEYSIHVRESYHAQLEYELNKIMKIFTVVTTIFLPLTLIVGWYGMNFTTMPELSWKYGYLYVILLSIVVAIICFIFFKKKKFM